MKEKARDKLTWADVELMSAEQLIAMVRDGWTPQQVRTLIQRYLELSRVVAQLRAEAKQGCDARGSAR